MQCIDMQHMCCMCITPLENWFKKLHPSLYLTFQVTFQDPGSLVSFGLCIFMLVVFRIKQIQSAC